jgi:hypothetical protein
VQQLADLAEQLKQEAKPIDALRQWMRSNVKFVATKKGMSAALALAAYKNPELYSYSFDRLTRAVGGLLDRAIAAPRIATMKSPAQLDLFAGVPHGVGPRRPKRPPLDEARLEMKLAGARQRVVVRRLETSTRAEVRVHIRVLERFREKNVRGGNNPRRIVAQAS